MPTFSQLISFVQKNRARILEQLKSWIGHFSLPGTFKTFALSTRTWRTELIFNFYFRGCDYLPKCRALRTWSWTNPKWRRPLTVLTETSHIHVFTMFAAQKFGRLVNSQCDSWIFHHTGYNYDGTSIWMFKSLNGLASAEIFVRVSVVPCEQKLQ